MLYNSCVPLKRCYNVFMNTNIVKKKFDIETHKKNFINYFEVMIDLDGDTYYSEPSHQEFLILQAMQRMSCTRDELMDRCPKEYYTDLYRWLIPLSGGWIPVWRDGILNYPVNLKQKLALRRYKMAGLYLGYIPEVSDEGREIVEYWNKKYQISG